MSKSKRTKHISLGALLAVEMLKECTPLWREAHFQSQSVKNWGSRTTSGRSDAVSCGRRKVFCTLLKVSKNVRVLSQFQLQPPNYTTLHSTTLHYNYNFNQQPQLHYTIYITLHYTTLHYAALHYTSYIALHYTPPPHSTTLPTTTTTTATTTTATTAWHYITLHSATLRKTTVQHTTLH